MSERLAFDYAIVQVVPRVDRDERHQRRRDPVLSGGGVPRLSHRARRGAPARAGARRRHRRASRAQLDAVRAVCAGDPAAGPIARLSPSERFHWLTTPRSTVVQPSSAHAGLCDDPAAALERLFRSVVTA